LLEAISTRFDKGSLQDVAVHFARESARMRWFYFDGIYLHYELDYSLR